MPQINAARAFVLVLDDGSNKRIAKGIQTVDDDVANHSWTKANLVGAKPNPGEGTPAYMRAAAEERHRLDEEHRKLEAETDKRVTANVRAKMEADLGESMRIALERQADAATRGVELDASGFPELDALVEARVNALVEARVKAAVDEALLEREIKAEEDAKTAGGKSAKAGK